MSKYLEHEEKVKYMDGVLEHSQEWQWFIDLLENKFDYPQFGTWEDFLVENHDMKDVLSYFIKIQSVCNKEFVFSKQGFYEMWQIAKFYNGSLNYEKCQKTLDSIFGKVMEFCIYVTKLSNASFEKDYIFDISVMYLANYFELENFDELSLYEDELLQAAEVFKDLPGFDVPYQILKDNFFRTERKYSKTFFEDNEEHLVNYNSIDWNRVKSEQYCTWQEKFLLDMLNVSFSDGNISPAFVSNNRQIPDTSLWTKTVLERMKTFFRHKSANFVIETILSFIDGTKMSLQTKLMHLKLLNDIFSSISHHEFMQSSSFLTISRLMKNGEIKECQNAPLFLELLQKIQAIDEYAEIEHLKEKGWYISNEQKKKLNEFYRSKYKMIFDIDRFEEIAEYTRDKTNAKQIDNECFEELAKKFRLAVASKGDINVSSLFKDYMLFLLTINGQNPNFDKRKVNKEMINIQKLWRDEYYSKQAEQLKPIYIENDKGISNTDLHKFNDIIIINPVVFAKYCFPCSDDEILQMMCRIAQMPLTVMVNHINISSIFPICSSKIVIEKHDIDALMHQKIKEILDQKGYKLLNPMTADEFLFGIYREFKYRTEFNLSIFNKIHDLYDIVKQDASLELIPFSEKISIAMVAQLFPLLEERIRELAVLFGFFPFKSNEKSFMIYNDPSSLMREIIKMVFEGNKSFELIPDLLFIYNMMYNSNSFNIRNECIHGRNYISGGSLNFAFVATLLSIHMINFRINTIKENTSDLLNSDTV